jgi:hypothetical protein
MATWHQLKKQEYIQEAYKPHKSKWKVVVDKYGRPLNVSTFDNRNEAVTYADKTQGIFIQPERLTR